MLPLLWTSALPPATGPARLTCTGGASCSYQCGIYPNDYSRFSSDWSQIYQTPYTPTIAPLPWFSVFGEPPALQCLAATTVQRAFTLPQLVLPLTAASADRSVRCCAGNHDIVINGAAPRKRTPVLVLSVLVVHTNQKQLWTFA